MKIDNIRCNESTGGYCCDFYTNGKKFYADVSSAMFCGPECMIFKYNENNEIDWSGVYVNRDVDVSEESLLKCVKEFTEQLDETHPRVVKKGILFKLRKQST